MKAIVLPGLTIESECDLEITMMVLGGRKPSADWMRSLDFYRSMWAVDSGADPCFESGMLPCRFVGDADSASTEALQWIKDNGVDISRFKRDKDLTDFQIALDLLSKENSGRERALFITGGFAGRFDHLWAAVISFLSCAKNIRPLGMADQTEGIIFLHGPEKLRMDFRKLPGAISLISFTCESRGVFIDGVRWPLEDVVLKYGEPYSISNRLAGGREAKISVGQGTVGVYWVWDA
ncbi:MAG: thiamine diphosphokinase [Synergistaceae bacterium]|nr:thiamine diphosphokinase [Synergistaceae bacterium]